jgi:hypothetical protein
MMALAALHPLGHLAGFNAFWYSHHLLVVVYLLLLVHGWLMFLVSKWYQRTVRDLVLETSLLDTRVVFLAVKQMGTWHHGKRKKM